MASLIAARDDGVGITGPVDDADVLSGTVSEVAGFEVVSLLPDHIRWAVDQGADVINMSFHAKCAFGPFGWDCTHEQTGAAIEYAPRPRVVVVASGGNRGDEGSPLQWPAGFDGVIAVSNHDRDGRRHPTSTANENIDISALGTDVLAAGQGSSDDDARCRDGYTDRDHTWASSSRKVPVLESAGEQTGSVHDCHAAPPRLRHYDLDTGERTGRRRRRHPADRLSPRRRGAARLGERPRRGR